MFILRGGQGGGGGGASGGAETRGGKRKGCRLNLADAHIDKFNSANLALS